MSTLHNIAAMTDRAMNLSAVVGTIPSRMKGLGGFAPTPDKRWWILRAACGQELKALEYNSTDGRDSIAYCALHYVEKPFGESVRKVLDTLIPGILFVCCTEQQAREYVSGTPQTSCLSFLYDEADQTDTVPQPAYADHDAMMNLIRAVTADPGAAKRVSDAYIHYRDEHVYVATSGDYEGVWGRLARVSNQTCLVVELPGVARIVTRYIPTGCVSRVERQQPLGQGRTRAGALGMPASTLDPVGLMMFRMRCWHEIGDDTVPHTLPDYTALLTDAPLVSRGILRHITASYPKDLRCSGHKINELAELLVTALLAQYFCPWYGLDTVRLIQFGQTLLKRVIDKQLLCYLCILLYAFSEPTVTLRRTIDAYLSGWDETTLTPEDHAIRQFYHTIREGAGTKTRTHFHDPHRRRVKLTTIHNS